MRLEVVVPRMVIRSSVLLLLVILGTPLDAQAAGPFARFQAWRAARRLEKSGVIVLGASGHELRGLTTMLGTLAAETRLTLDARERVAAGKRPTWRQRRFLHARISGLRLEADAAAKSFEHARPSQEPGWMFSAGADWLNALTSLEGAHGALGELTPARKRELAESRRTAAMTIFDRMTGEIHELADAGMHLSIGRGAVDYEQLMRRMGDRDGRGVLPLVRQWAVEAAPEQSRALYSRWARADLALTRMAETRRAFEEKSAGVGLELGWQTLRGRSLRDVGRMTEKRQMEMYVRGELDHLRAPAQLLANVPPELLLRQIERGDFAGWGDKLGLSDAAFAEELASGLRLSFSRAYQRSLGRVRATLAHENPLLAADGQAALAALRGTIALAARHGVAIDPGQLPEAPSGRTLEDFEAIMARARPEAGEHLAEQRSRYARVRSDHLLGEEQLSQLERSLGELAARKAEIEVEP